MVTSSRALNAGPLPSKLHLRIGNGQHTSYCENYPEPNIYKSKRKIAFNIGYFSQFTRDSLEAKGYDVDAMLAKQNQWKKDFERDMAYATG